MKSIKTQPFLIYLLTGLATGVVAGILGSQYLLYFLIPLVIGLLNKGLAQAK